MRWVLVLVALATGSKVARAEQPVGTAVGEPVVATFVAATVEEGIWTWIERMEGEVLPEAARRALDEDADALAAERSVYDALGAISVPADYYTDPATALSYDPLFLDEIDLSEFDLPVSLHARVQERMRLFLGPHRKYFKVWLERKSRYEGLIRSELAAAGMPQDLIYLSMIESGFNAYAYSHAAAAGLWQFIPSTGEMYDLRIDWWVDERRDPEKSTKAALKMLSELHEMFDDWYLAFAAYNTGPGRVRRAVQRARGEEGRITYWDLVDQDLLHPETKDYVPKILAAAIIAKHPERYGFVDLVPQAPLAYETVVVDQPVELAVLAECAGIDEAAFQALNPALRRYATPEGETAVRIPPGKSESFLAAYKAVPPAELIRIVRHRVGSGETLSTIAAKYSVDSASIAKANQISNPNRISVGQWLVIPTRGEAAVAPVTSVTRRTVTPTTTTVVPSGERVAPVAVAQVSAPPANGHVVARGETLSTIASRYGVSVANLQAWNDIRDASMVQVGQRLHVAEPSSGSSAAAAAPAEAPAKQSYTVASGDTISEIADRFGVGTSELMSWNGIRDARSLKVGQRLVIQGGTAPASSAGAAPAGQTVKHTVRSGDTLSEIADKYGVRIADLQAWNGLSDPRSLRVGQVLTVRGQEGGWTTYTVARGDTLGLIASRHGVSTDDLRSWNNLSGSTIYPGQKLKIRAKG
jgi:membrane-bound lytic murein transglycosylase D